jgi:type IV pilus assembly protein PilO
MSTSRPSSAWSERLKSPLTWHVVGFVVLLIIAVALGIRLGFDWTAMDSHSNDVYANKQVQLKALQLQTAPLRGLDGRVEQTREKMVSFEKKRIPPNYSSIDARIGELQIASGVRISRVQYTQGPPGTGLTEISVDTNISGDYPAIMRFVNSIERDQTFFVIRTMSFTGAQGGLVNLRMQLSTWLRPADAVASGLPSTPQNEDQTPAPAPAPAPDKEGE